MISLTQIKRFKKIKRKDRFLKQLVAVYSSPWSKRRGTFRDHDRAQSQRNQEAIQHRFEQDVQHIVQQVLQTLQLQQVSQIPTALQKSGLDTHASQNIVTALDLLISSVPKNALDALPSPASVQPSTHFSPVQLLRWILDRVIDEPNTVAFYDQDFIDDIVPIIQSRYIGPDGLTNPTQSGPFLNALWVLCDHAQGSEPILSQLPQALKNLLGNVHPYQPKRYDERDYLKSLVPDDYETFINLRCQDDPALYATICAKIFEVINAKATPHYEERDLSLIYGYENNHHLMLRTLIDLITTGQITSEDEVLILGPRYVDEVLFFRNILGLKKTIGLDLRDEDNLLFKGDMHQIPFEDRRFKLVFGANVFEYAYDLRQVVNEIARVLQRPGYVAGIFRSNRHKNPSPTGRTDVGSLEAVSNLFYNYPHQILARDPGLTPHPEKIGNFPAIIFQLTEGSAINLKNNN